MYLDDAVAAITGFEGRIQWMYLCTADQVTVGTGEMIPTAHAALSYPFRRPNAEFSNAEEILAEFDRVSKMPSGYTAKSYRRSGSLLLADEDIDKALQQTVKTCVSDLASLFPNFHDFPDPAKVALIDMRFNLGFTKLRVEYPKLCQWVKAQRWEAASLECHRIGPSEERNAWAKEQFLLAGNIAREQTL